MCIDPNLWGRIPGSGEQQQEALFCLLRISAVEKAPDISKVKA